MAEQWVRVWHQAMTRAFADGKVSGHNKTIAFAIEAPVAGTQVRLCLSNRLGEEPVRIAAINLLVGKRALPVKQDGRRSFSIPAGSTCTTDACEVFVTRGQRLELRMFYLDDVLDCNMIEDGATLLRGSHVADVGPLPRRKPLLARFVSGELMYVDFGALLGEQAGLTPSINSIDLDAILQMAMARAQQ